MLRTTQRTFVPGGYVGGSHAKKNKGQVTTGKKSAKRTVYHQDKMYCVQRKSDEMADDLGR